MELENSQISTNARYLSNVGNNPNRFNGIELRIPQRNKVSNGTKTPLQAKSSLGNRSARPSKFSFSLPRSKPVQVQVKEQVQEQNLEQSTDLLPAIYPFSKEYDNMVFKTKHTDNGTFTCVVFSNSKGNKRRTVTLMRVIASSVLGEILTQDVTVFPIDGDHNNLALSNIGVKYLKEAFAKEYEFTCPHCGKKHVARPSLSEYDLAVYQIKTREKYCSNVCLIEDAKLVSPVTSRKRQRTNKSKDDFYEYFTLA